MKPLILLLSLTILNMHLPAADADPALTPLPTRPIKVDGAIDDDEWRGAPEIALTDNEGSPLTHTAIKAAHDGPVLLLALRHDRVQAIQSARITLSAADRTCRIVLTPQDLAFPILAIERRAGDKRVDDDSPPRMTLGIRYPEGRFPRELGVDRLWAFGGVTPPATIGIGSSLAPLFREPVAHTESYGGGQQFAWTDPEAKPSREYKLEGASRIVEFDRAAREGWRAAIDRLDRGDASGALTVLLTLAEQSPRQAMPRRMAARLSERMDHRGQALDLIEGAVARRGPLPVLIDREADLRYAVGDFDGCLATIERLPEDERRGTNVRLLRIRCLFAAERFDDTLEALDRLEEADDIPATERIELRRRIAQLRTAVERLQDAMPEEKRRRRAEADTAPRLRIRTTDGELTVLLYEKDAPDTVANVMTLADEGYYDGLRFFGFEPAQQVMTGDPNTRGADRSLIGQGGAPPIAREDSGRLALRGTLVMDRQGRQSSGSRFTTLLSPDVGKSGTHTVFGRVVEGLEKVGRFSPETKIIGVKLIMN